MLLNFALESLGTDVSCNKISTDNYECNNLISSDPRRRCKGFMAEHFIKPPVDLTFVFPCHVNIFCVLVDPFVRGQQSSQIEVYCASKPMPKTRHGQRRAEDSKHVNTTIQHELMPLFYPVSKMNFPNQTRICFYSGRFSSYRSSQHQNLTRSIESHARAEMRHAKPELLISATHMTIRILRILNGSTPALNNIEIWGCIASGVNEVLKTSICAKYQAFSQPSACIASPECLSSVQERVSSATSSTKSKTNEELQIFDDVQIPEEFLDPLTCEIMSIPMLLPSGKNADKSTLERYFDSEASHGRQPRDPFTGVEFNGNAKPIPNGPLKARIDHFLSEKRDNPSIRSLPRTVCSGNVSNLPRKRKRDDASLDISLVDNMQNGTSVCIHNNSKNFINGSSHTNTSKCVSTTVGSFPTPSPVFEPSSSTSLLSNISDGDSNQPCPSQSTKCQRQIQTVATLPVGHTHELSLKDSLDNALFALLGSSSAKTEKDFEDPFRSQTKLSSCSKCQIDFTAEVLVYSIPCSHFLCRECLLSMGSDSRSSCRCEICGASFLRSDVVRKH